MVRHTENNLHFVYCDYGLWTMDKPIFIHRKYENMKISYVLKKTYKVMYVRLDITRSSDKCNKYNILV